MESFLRSWLSGPNWPATQECFFSPFSRRAKAGEKQARSAGGETRDEGSSLSFNRLKKLEEITPVLQARYESPWRRRGVGGVLFKRERASDEVVALTIADGCGVSSRDKQNSSQKDGASVPKRRVSDGNNPFSTDFISRSRPSSFHDVELTPVPEVTISPDGEHIESGESSRSQSPSSRVRTSVFLKT